MFLFFFVKWDHTPYEAGTMRWGSSLPSMVLLYSGIFHEPWNSTSYNVDIIDLKLQLIASVITLIWELLSSGAYFNSYIAFLWLSMSSSYISDLFIAYFVYKSGSDIELETWLNYCYFKHIYIYTNLLNQHFTLAWSSRWMWRHHLLALQCGPQYANIYQLIYKLVLVLDFKSYKLFHGK